MHFEHRSIWGKPRISMEFCARLYLQNLLVNVAIGYID
jgi:hypothetical protein